MVQITIVHASGKDINYDLYKYTRKVTVRSRRSYDLLALFKVCQHRQIFESARL